MSIQSNSFLSGDHAIDREAPASLLQELCA